MPTLITASTLREWPLPRPEGSKRSRGQVLVAGGSPSTPGAVVLAGLAALRVGAGVLALAVARSVAAATAVTVLEASVHGLARLDRADRPEHGGDGASEFDDVLGGALSGADAVVIGCGLDEPDGAADLVRAAVNLAGDDAAFVLDAFALGVLPGLGADVARAFAGRTVLTPNSTEAAHLLEADAGDLQERDSEDVAEQIARRFAATVSYQGTIAAADGKTWQISTGHAGLGTSGSGDVLAGAVAGLLARGADPAQAACWATFLHATAGDRLAPRVGRLGFLARELVDELPLVLVQTEA